MKFIVSVALFVASFAAAADEQEEVYVKREWPPDEAPWGMPEGDCLNWDDEVPFKPECVAPWARFNDYCSKFWDKTCEKIDAAWYDQDIEFKKVEPLEDKCVKPNMDDSCRLDLTY